MSDERDENREKLQALRDNAFADELAALEAKGLIPDYLQALDLKEYIEAYPGLAQWLPDPVGEVARKRVVQQKLQRMVGQTGVPLEHPQWYVAGDGKWRP